MKKAVETEKKNDEHKARSDGNIYNKGKRLRENIGTATKKEKKKKTTVRDEETTEHGKIKKRNE